LNDSDQAESEPVAIVNEALVSKYFPRENPVGKRIQVGKPGSGRPWLTIVGVAGNEKDKEFFHEMNWEEIPFVFRPVAQAPPLSVSLVLRTAGNNLALGAAIQKQISALDNSVPVGEVEAMNKRLCHVLAYPRFRAIVLGTFAGLAVLLAGVGLYGILSQLIAQRTQEFGVRMALGAQKRDVLTMVLRQGMLLTAAGLAAGSGGCILFGEIFEQPTLRRKCSRPMDSDRCFNAATVSRAPGYLSSRAAGIQNRSDERLAARMNHSPVYYLIIYAARHAAPFGYAVTERTRGSRL
jgi:hypothetical protein